MTLENMRQKLTYLMHFQNNRNLNTPITKKRIDTDEGLGELVKNNYINMQPIRITPGENPNYYMASLTAKGASCLTTANFLDYLNFLS